jgi:hypothetical protein
MKQKKLEPNQINRRDFLKGSSAASVMTLLGGVELNLGSQTASAVDADKLHGPVVKSAVIGLGARGREMVGTLARLPEAEVAVLCDTYAAGLRRAAKEAPAAASVSDYRRC